MQILTKNIIKEIRSLEQRKGRREQSAWLAEGNKLVGDLLKADTFRCRRIVATSEWWQEHPDMVQRARETYEVSYQELERVSLLPSPQDVLAVFDLPKEQMVQNNQASCSKVEESANSEKHTIDDIAILLDEIQDPGNLGTIIRTADWYGVRHIYCSPGTADCFNPKVVQATMSALARVKLHYFETKQDVCQWMQQLDCPKYGTFLEGSDIYHTTLNKERALLIMGNEGRGVSAEVAALITDKLLIPSFAKDGNHVESLNVSIATAICLSELRR